MFRRILQLCNVRKFKFKRKLTLNTSSNKKTKNARKKHKYKKKYNKSYILVTRDDGWTANSNDVYKKKRKMAYL